MAVAALRMVSDWRWERDSSATMLVRAVTAMSRASAVRTRARVSAISRRQRVMWRAWSCANQAANVVTVVLLMERTCSVGRSVLKRVPKMPLICSRE